MGPNSSSHFVNDAVDSGESDAGTFKFTAVVETLKRGEYFGRVLGVETDSVVAHEECRFAVDKSAFDLNYCRGARTRVFHGVGEEIGKSCFMT